MKKGIFAFLGLLLLAITAQASSTAKAEYSGTVRVYIVEPLSRWQDATSVNYHFGFLDFALIEPISISSDETWHQTIVFDAGLAGYPDIQEDNIMAIAVVFNGESVEHDAFPPNGNMFNAYYVDAAAAASPGNPGQNEVYGDYTHTVFVEEASETG